MTIINRSRGFIFIHIPKTGGTSLKEYLREYRSPIDIHVNRPGDAQPLLDHRQALKKHSPAVRVRDALGEHEFARLFKFSVVRNPFVRTISSFRFLKFNFRSWPRSGIMDRIGSLEEFVASPIFAGAGPGGIISPQVDWITDESGTSCMDFLARVETIEEDFRDIKNRLGLAANAKPLLKKNESRGDAAGLIAELDSARVVDAIRARYASDFRLLGYTTNPDDAVHVEENAASA